MEVQPLGDRFLVEQDKHETVSGLVLSEESTLKRPLGTVVAVGDGYGAQMSRVKVGSRICFNELAGELVSIEKKEYLIISLSDILILLR